MIPENLARDALSEVTFSQTTGKKGDARSAEQVNESWSDGLAGCIDRLGRGSAREVSDCDDPIALDAEVDAARFGAGSIEDRAAGDDEIELRRLRAGEAHERGDDEGEVTGHRAGSFDARSCHGYVGGATRSDEPRATGGPNT